MTPSRDDRGAPGKKPGKPLNAKPEPTGKQAIEKALQEKAAADKKAGKSSPATGTSVPGALDSPAAKPFPKKSDSDRDGRHRAPDRGPKHRLDDDRKRPRPATGSSAGLMSNGNKPAFGNSQVPPVPHTTGTGQEAAATPIPVADSFAGEVDTPPATTGGQGSADKKPAPLPTAYGTGDNKPDPAATDSAAAKPEARKKPEQHKTPEHKEKPAAKPAKAASSPEPKPDALDSTTTVPAPAAEEKTVDPKPTPESGSKTAVASTGAADTGKNTSGASAAKTGQEAPATPSAPAVSESKDKQLASVSNDSEPRKAATKEPVHSSVADTGSNKQIKITEKAMNKVIAAAVRAVPGTISRSDGIDKLTGRNYPRYEVKLDDDGDAIAIDAFIAVGWPAPVAKIAEKTRETIITWVGDMTDVPVVHANVTVGYVEPGHDRVTVAQIDAFDPHPRLTPVKVTQSRPNVPIVTNDWDITPHTVKGEVAENIRSIPVPEPVKLHPFSAGVVPQASKPVTKPAAELRPVVNTWELELSPVEVTPGVTDLAKITVADEMPLKPITVADQAPEVPVTVADQKPLAPITVAEAADLQSIEVNAFGELKPVQITDSGDLSDIRTRQPIPLAAIDTHPSPVREIAVPKPAPLNKVTEPTPHRLADVTAPTPVRLAEVRVAKTPKLAAPDAPKLRLARIVSPDGHKVAHPQPPAARRLAKIEVASREVRSVTQPADPQVASDLLPAEKPLKEITVSPLNVRSIKVVDK